LYSFEFLIRYSLEVYIKDDKDQIHNLFKKPEFWIIICATVIATFMRSIGLGDLSLWYDEGFSSWSARLSIIETLRLSFSVEPNPPLYPIFLRFWSTLFGDSEWALRFPSLIFSGLCIAAVGWLGWRFVSPRVGTVAALWTMASPIVIEYSREARVYSSFCFFSLLAMGSMPVLGKPWSRSMRWLHIIATSAALWLHAYAFFLIPAQIVYILGQYLYSKKTGFASTEANQLLEQAIRSFTTIGLLTFWWYMAVVLNSSDYIDRFSWIDGLDPVLPMFIDAYFQLTQWTPGFVVLSIFALSFLYWLRNGIFLKFVTYPAWALALFTLFSLALPLIIGHFWQPIFVPRYAMAAVAVAHIWLLVPLATLLDRQRILFVLLCGGLSLSAASTTYYQITNTRKEEWQLAIQSLTNEEPGTLLLVTPAYYAYTSPDYYLRKLGLNKQIITSYPKDKNEFSKLITKYQRLWLAMVNSSGDSDIKPEWLMEQNFRPGREVTFHKIQLKEFIREE